MILPPAFQDWFARQGWQPHPHQLALLAATVDHARGHMHEHVENDRFLTFGRAEITRQQSGQLVAYTLDGVQRAKKWLEVLRSGHDSGRSIRLACTSNGQCRRRRARQL